MNEIVNAYIQQAGLDKTQAQQLMQELQALDETQLQQVLGKMQQQLQGNEEAMQYGGYEKWKKALPKNLQQTDTTLYNLRGAYEGGLVPEMSEDGMYHLGSRNPKTGELLKSPKHPTFNKMIEGEAQAGYEVYEKNGKLYSRPKSKQQYGGLPVDEDGLYAYPNQSVVVPTQNTGAITMKGINQPVAAYDADTMKYLDMMYPDQEYEFDADNILEVPQMQMGGKREAYYTNYLDKYASELDELEILKSNKQAGYLNAPQAKRLAELESRHSKFSKDFKRATKTEIPSSVKDFTVDEEKEFNDLLKKERSDKRKLTIAENKRLKELKEEQERLDALKPLAEKPLKRKRTYAGATINQIREENAKYLAEAKVRDAKLEKAGFQFKPKNSPAPASVSPVKPSISPIQTSVDPNVTKELLTKQSSIQGRGENIKLLSEKLKDPSLTKTQRDAVFSQLQKLTKDGTSFPKTSKFDFKKSAINAGEEVLDAVTGLARNKWVNRATDVLGTVGGIAGGALAALDIFNTAEEGRGSVGALEFLNDTSPLGKKYQKLYEERLNKDSIWNADTINRELGNAYYEEKLKQPATQQANVNRGVNPTSAISTSQYSGNFPVTSAQNRPSVTGVVDNYSGNTPVEAIGNSNLRVGNRVDTVGGTPVRDFGITNKNPSRTGEYDFISQLQGKTNRAENIDDYVSWKNEWNDMIPNFASKSYKEQQKAAMDWVKTNKPDVYEGLRKQWESQGYKKGDSFEGYLKDGMYANITSSLRPSLLNDRVAPIDPLERKPTGLNTKIPTTLPLADIQKKVSVPTIEDDSINPADAIIGKLDNRDMSGRYLSNMKLRNNEIKLPYFGQVDLKTPQLYQQDIAPYVNNLYTGYNAAVQNIDMNSAVGQAQALQLNANLDKSINDVSGTVYNQNLKAAIDWENQLTGIYNQQSQLDNQNRAAYSDGVDLVRTNKQNVDNQIDALAYEHKMKQIQNQNKMVLSTLLHPDFYTTDEGNGQMVLKRKYNKAPTANSTPTNTNPSIEAERDFWKDLALKNSKTKAAKYGIGKKKAC
jgi:hypothetical protein